MPITSYVVRAAVSGFPRGAQRMARLLSGRGEQAVFALPGRMRGVCMGLDTSDCFQAEMAFGVYGREIIDRIAGLKRSGDRVLAAGANIGYMPLALAVMGCEVIAFEADPRNVEVCCANLALNSRLKVKLVGKGLSDRAGQLQMWLSDVRSNSSFARSHQAADRLDVTVVRGDDALSELGVERLDGMLLDVEGWECHALEGLRGTIRRSLPRWAVIENADWALRGAGKTSGDLHALIRSLGFSIMNPGGHDLVCLAQTSEAARRA